MRWSTDPSTRVEPAELVDPATPPGAGGPPADAIDVQFRAPISLSLYVDALDRAGHVLDVRAITTAYEQLMAQTVTQLQYEAGYVRVAGTSWPVPARLELAAFGENRVPGISAQRLHCHLYVGRTARTLTDGPRWPVDLEGLQSSVDNVLWAFYVNRLRAVVELVTGCTWGEPRPGAALEIVDPPLHEHLAGHERGVCLGPWGPRQLLMADERSLGLAAERERQIARERARGIVY